MKGKNRVLSTTVEIAGNYFMNIFQRFEEIVTVIIIYSDIRKS